ncbi:MAG: hypothetical protein P8M18_02455 [Woeseiaceae bacterium]|nr:hypothetical protein [Woeseiaceae bacterium]
MRRISALIVLTVILGACAGRVHTLESTQHLSRNELLALCEDLAMRAEQDCQWNIEQRQSDLSNQQTWEINCRARRDSARESYDNVCQSSRFRAPDVIRE